MNATWTERAMMKPGLVEWMAWRRYLTTTRASSSATYSIIEEAAWLRLQEDLTRFGSLLSTDLSLAGQRTAARGPVDLYG
jgi:hypothetical protein